MTKRTKSQLLDDLSRAAAALRLCKSDLRDAQRKCAAQASTIGDLRKQVLSIRDSAPKPEITEVVEKVVRKGRLEDEVEIARLRAENNMLRRGL